MGDERFSFPLILVSSVLLVIRAQMRTKLPALQAERDKLQKELDTAKEAAAELQASVKATSSKKELDEALKAKRELEKLRDSAVKAAEKAAEKAERQIATLRDEKKALTKENHKLAKDADAARLEVMQLRDLRLGKTTSAKEVEKQAAQRQAALLKEAETLTMEHQRELEEIQAAAAAAAAAAAGQVAAKGDVVSETSAALGAVQSKLRAAESSMVGMQRADALKAKRIAALESKVEALEAELRQAAGEGGVGQDHAASVQEQSGGKSGGSDGNSGQMQELEKLAGAYKDQLEAAKAARKEDAASMKALQEQLTTLKEKATEAAKSLAQAEARQHQAEAAAAEASNRAKMLKETLAASAASHDAEMRESAAAVKASAAELKAVRSSALELKSAKEALAYDLQVVKEKLAKAEAQVEATQKARDAEVKRLETRAAELSAQVDEALRAAGGEGTGAALTNGRADGDSGVGNGLADRVASLEVELAAKHSTVTDLSVRILELEGDIEAMQSCHLSETTGFRTQVTSLSAEVSQLRASKQEEVAKLQREARALKAELRSAGGARDSSLDAVQTQARTLQGEMDRAKEAAASAKAIAESTIAETQEALSTMRIELDQMRHANEVLQKEVKLARVEAGSATQMSKDMRSAKDRAEARLAEQAATLESTASTVDKLQKRVREKEEAAMAAEQALVAVTEQGASSAAAAAARIGALEAELAGYQQLEEVIQVLEADLKEAREAPTVAAAETSSLRLRVAAVEHDLQASQTMVAKLAKFKEGAVDWESLERGLTAKLQAATEELDAVKAEAKAAQVQCRRPPRTEMLSCATLPASIHSGRQRALAGHTARSVWPTANF
jgi:chromosome segregation ATPase